MRGLTKEYIKKYKKEKDIQNPASNITYQKARYQENPGMQLYINNADTMNMQRITKNIKNQGIRKNPENKTKQQEAMCRKIPEKQI